MKNWKHWAFVAVIAVVVIIIGFVACKEEDDPPPVITREFNDLTYFGKSIKLIDETGNAQDLKARGIWQKIQDGFNASHFSLSGAKKRLLPPERCTTCPR